MCQKRSKRIGVFTILFLFILGLYFDPAKDESCIQYALLKTSESDISPVAPVFTGVQACTEEIQKIGRDKGTEQIIPRFISIKRDNGKTADLHFHNRILLYEGNLCPVFETVPFPSENLKEIVMNFIHESDGKKRI